MNPLELHKESKAVWDAGFEFGCIDSAYRHQARTSALENQIESLELTVAALRHTFNSWPYRGAK